MSPSNNTVPEKRVNKDGVLVTKHVNPDKKNSGSKAGGATRDIPTAPNPSLASVVAASPRVAELINRIFPDSAEGWFGQKDSPATRLDRAINDAVIDGSFVVSLLNEIAGDSAPVNRDAAPIPMTKSGIEEYARSLHPEAEARWNSSEQRWEIEFVTNFTDGYVMTDAMRESPAGQWFNSGEDVHRWARKNGASGLSTEELLWEYNSGFVRGTYEREFLNDELKKRGLYEEYYDFLDRKITELSDPSKDFLRESYDDSSDFSKRREAYIRDAMTNDKNGYAASGIIAPLED